MIGYIFQKMRLLIFISILLDIWLSEEQFHFSNF